MTPWTFLNVPAQSDRDRPAAQSIACRMPTLYKRDRPGILISGPQETAGNPAASDAKPRIFSVNELSVVTRQILGPSKGSSVIAEESSAAHTDRA